MKKIAVIYYSQSGRSEQVIQRLAKNTKETDETTSFSFFKIEEKKQFAFPWSFSNFFEAFPEAVLQTPLELLPLNCTDKYDLILFVYPVWYLSPATPVSSFLHSSEAKKFIKNTPVITIITCRDMWVQAQEDVKNAVKAVDSKVVGNVVLSDEYNTFKSLVTTLYWFLTGKNQKPFGIFPSPMVKENQLKKVDDIKVIISEKLQKNKLNELQKIFVENKFTTVDDYKILLEARIKKIFTLWARFIKNSGSHKKRKFKLLLFKIYLSLTIIFIMPISFILSSLFFPFIKGKIKKMRNKILMS